MKPGVDMKRILSIVFPLIILLSGCSLTPHVDTSSITSLDETPQKTNQNKSVMNAVWFSYIELNFVNATQDVFKNTISTMFTKVKNAGFNAVICQVRANCDAIYPSDYFPFSAAFTGQIGVAPDFDPLEIMVNLAHSLGLEFHAWINPYRVSAKSKDYESLPQNSPVYKY